MNFGRAIATIGSLTLVSRVFGLIREMLIARFLGASLITDAFFVAFKFPNLFRRIFAEGAFNAAFVPIFSEKLVTQGQEEALHFARSIYTGLAFVLMLLVGGVLIFTPSIMNILAPGFVNTPERLELATTFIRITFPYILFISLCAQMGGVLNSFGRFAATAFIPTLLNIMMIASILMAHIYQWDYGVCLSVGVLLSGAIQFLWLKTLCRRYSLRMHIQWPRWTSDLKRFFLLLGPGIVGSSVASINVFIDTIIASFLPEKSISYIYYADRLNQLPLSLFGIALGTALLPMLSQQLKSGAHNAAQNTQDQAIELTLVMTVPAMVGLCLLSYEIMALIFALTPFETQQTAHSLVALSLGLPAYCLTKVYSALFFARQDTKTPVYIGGICIVVNIIISLSLMSSLAHVALALATSISSWLNVLLLGYIAINRGWYRPQQRLKRLFWIQTACISLMIASIFLVKYSCLEQRSYFWYLVISIGSGGAVYAGMGAYMGLYDPRHIKSLFCRTKSS